MRTWASYVRLVVALTVAVSHRRGHAQVLELSGGTSTLYEASGGTLSVKGSHYETGVSAGVEAGQFVGGGFLIYRTPTARYTLGSEELNLNLPTDILTATHRLLGVGADVLTTRQGTTIEAFGGATSTRFDAPLFQGIRANQPAAALLLRRNFTPTFTASSQILYTSGSLSALQGLSWKVNPSLGLALSSGIAGGARYNAASVALKRPLIDLKASYVDAGTGFHRTGSEIDLTPEPIRENLMVTLRSSVTHRFTLSGSRQNLMVSTVDPTTLQPLDVPGQVSTSDQVSGTARLGNASLSASVMHSTFNGVSNLAYLVGATRPVTTRLQMGATYFGNQILHSPSPETGSGALVGHLQETLTSRFTANQTVTLENGQSTAGFGGSFLSNIATISADYQTFYIATRPDHPFQQTLVLDTQMNFFGRITVHGATSVSPTGKLLYTADAHAAVARPGTVVATTERSSFGLSMLAGRVVDTAGNPIEGAAIGIEDHVVYTNADGDFLYREKRPTEHELIVLVDQFLDGQRYWVVSKAARDMSTLAWRPPTVIVLDRKGSTFTGPGRRPLIDQMPVRRPGDVFGVYVPYQPGMRIDPRLKPGDIIPAPDDTPTTAKPDEIYGPYVAIPEVKQVAPGGAR